MWFITISSTSMQQFGKFLSDKSVTSTVSMNTRWNIIGWKRRWCKVNKIDFFHACHRIRKRWTKKEIDWTAENTNSGQRPINRYFDETHTHVSLSTSMMPAMATTPSPHQKQFQNAHFRCNLCKLMFGMANRNHVNESKAHVCATKWKMLEFFDRNSAIAWANNAKTKNVMQTNERSETSEESGREENNKLKWKSEQAMKMVCIFMLFARSSSFFFSFSLFSFQFF